MKSRIVKPASFVLFDDKALADWFAMLYEEIKSVLDAKDLPFDEVALVWRDQISTGNNLLGLYINMSIDYVTKFSDDRSKCLAEAQGIIIHEFTKVFISHQAANIPEYVVSGTADYVRLKLGYAPSHWEIKREDNWKKGYSSTAKFFQYLNATYSNFISRFYNLLSLENYNENFFERLTGQNVERLHCKYSGYSYEYVKWNEYDYETTSLVINKSTSPVFATTINSPAATLREILIESMKLLNPTRTHPKILKLTLFVRDMDGVAYTTSSDDPYTSEIHLSSKYLDSYNANHNAKEMANELGGVLRHEMVVHVHQNNGRGTCHGGIIEGIADYCRLKLGFASPNWGNAPKPGKSWENGYETCGFFLNWLEDKRELKGFVVKLNEKLENNVWSQELFKELAGDSITNLWEIYLKDCIVEFNK